jgi:inosine-uridine nucleoside N-ribohydrolase
MKHFGEIPAAQIGDAGAVAAAIDPSVLTTKRMHVAVELRGQHTRGMTVVDPREWVMPPDRPKQPDNVDVSIGVDADAVKRLFTAAVLTPSASQ